MDVAYQILSKQLGRPLTVDCQIVVYCPQGFPAVTENKPWDKEGKPFPTLFWLSCPLAVKKVAQLEASGLIKELEQKLKSDSSLQAAFLSGVQAYQQRRHELLKGKDVNFSFLKSGVGGSSSLLAIKCLHAHLAHYLATKNNLVGELVFKQFSWANCNFCQKYVGTSSSLKK